MQGLKDFLNWFLMDIFSPTILGVLVAVIIAALLSAVGGGAYYLYTSGTWVAAAKVGGVLVALALCWFIGAVLLDN
jgi:hypothetical protein